VVGDEPLPVKRRKRRTTGEQETTGEFYIPAHHIKTRFSWGNWIALGSLLLAAVTALSFKMDSSYVSRSEAETLKAAVQLLNKDIQHHIKDAENKHSVQVKTNQEVRETLKQQSDQLHRIDVNIARIGWRDGVRVLKPGKATQ
jgi:septal ring factor EnvC (AmiA/AmiB activator)